MVKSETCRDAEILVKNPSPRPFGENFRDSKKWKQTLKKRDFETYQKCFRVFPFGTPAIGKGSCWELSRVTLYIQFYTRQANLQAQKRWVRLVACYSQTKSRPYPPRFYQWIDYLKNESISRSRNWCQIQSFISACVMSSEYFYFSSYTTTWKISAIWLA